MFTFADDNYDFMFDLEQCPTEDYDFGYSLFSSKLKAQAVVFLLIHSPRPCNGTSFGTIDKYLFVFLSFIV